MLADDGILSESIESVMTPTERAFFVHVDAVELAHLRARKYRALSALFRLDFAQYRQAIEALMVACPGIHDCPVVHGETHETGLEALEWSGASEDHERIAAEHIRLFGGADIARQMPMVSPCAAMYMSEEYDGSSADVTAAYRATGFVPVLGDGRCAAHISNELEFMAHCLDLMGTTEGRDAAFVAGAFLETHLFGWGVVFSAATYSRSQHPVTRFAGMMLEHMLFCELEHSRAYARAFGFPPLGRVAS